MTPPSANSGSLPAGNPESRGPGRREGLIPFNQPARALVPYYDAAGIRIFHGSNFAADRFKRVHEQAALFYQGQWRVRYHQPVTTPTSRVRRVYVRPDHQQPVHTGEIGSRRNYVRDEGGPQLMRSVIFARNEHHYAIHPTQKPVTLVGPLVEYACPPGGLALDPFMGSGTTLRVAKDRGMRAIGIELDEAMCEKAARRLDQEVLAL
jgi:site-specific DNA-methyltransferase (adenine-specific)